MLLSSEKNEVSISIVCYFYATEREEEYFRILGTASLLIVSYGQSGVPEEGC